MFTKKHPNESWLVFLLQHDQELRYLYLDTDTQGIFVRAYGTIDIENGVIEKGEILKAQKFLDILKKLKKNIGEIKKDTQHILLLPQEYVQHEHCVLPDINLKKKLSPQVKTFLEQDSELYPWLSTHSFQPVFDTRTQKIYLELIRADRYKSFSIVFEQAGFLNIAIHGAMTSLGAFVRNTKHSMVMVVSEHTTRILDFEFHHLIREKKFEFSPQLLLRIIRNHLKSVSPEYAKNILREYGISRAHREEKLYHELLRNLNPLASVMRKRTLARSVPVYICFTTDFILGLTDTLEQQLKIPIEEIDPFMGPSGLFHEVLFLPAQDKNTYSLLAAAALRYRSFD